MPTDALEQPYPPIAFADDASPFVPGPLIADILRTRTCQPGSIFLIENLETIHAPDRDGLRAIRLLLGDGELCIQAMLKSEAHAVVDSGEVGVGCYVQLRKFEMLWRDLDGEKEGKQLVLLVVEELDTVGWDNRYLDIVGHDEQEDRLDKEGNVEQDDGESMEAHGKGKLLRLGTDQDEEEQASGEVSELVLDIPSIHESAKHWSDGGGTAFPKDKARDSKSFPDDQRDGELPDHQERLEEDYLAGSNVDADVEDLLGNPPLKSSKSPPRPGSILGSDDVYDDEDVFGLMERRIMPSGKRKRVSDPQDAIAVPTNWSSPTKPLKLTALKSIPYLPYPQNWTINVLAIVASLSDVEPSNLKPYVQRTARLADPSTSKQVLLTVFLDPQEFTPMIGSVVLLAGVKNHRFDRGSLKKYANDRPKAGGRWWFEEPWEMEWCDVEGLKTWWISRQGT